ncbi:AzlD domain-containing protein [Acuticoccus yangtzensis]|uniref:AzlD domain-containing protein n=1 Tax=Acuticoccus yangtzensis TaxID=1443441 RepID=UPI00094958B2|nr:AzlD domain-containing protein [Acuticoccus yangtzensis]ORE94713.1 hypothetical protein ATO13_11576 [Stappia sp. 22II-S9-Z10]
MTEPFPSLDPWGTYLAILVAAALPTQVWRWIGVVLAGRMAETSEIFVWVKAVATALVAAVVAQLILNPGGAVADTPLLLRIGAIAAGFAVYLASGKTLAFGILTTEALLIGGWLALG